MSKSFEVAYDKVEDVFFLLNKQFDLNFVPSPISSWSQLRSLPSTSTFLTIFNYFTILNLEYHYLLRIHLQVNSGNYFEFLQSH